MTVLRKNPPNVLILTDGCISQAHGTGAVLLRHFEAYPPKRLLNVFMYYQGEPSWRRSLALQLHPTGLQMPYVSRKMRSVMRRTGFGYWYAPPDKLTEKLHALDCEPDIIYSNVFGADGLQALLGLMEHFGPRVPVIQHFHDLFTEGAAGFWSTAKLALPKVCETWAVTDSIAEEVRTRTGCPADVVSTFRCHIPPTFKRQHRATTDERFRIVMLGNIWQPATISAINAAWPRITARFKAIRPIEWACHRVAVDSLKRSGTTLEPAIRPVGFVPDNHLHRWLCDADLAIVPVSIPSHAHQDYAQYSLPSRITNLACAGLPILFIASEGTETHKFVQRTGIGRCSRATDETELGCDLLEFIDNQELRARYGAAARVYAEEHFDLVEYQRWLYGKLSMAGQ